jgi:hypothetical protein
MTYLYICIICLMSVYLSIHLIYQPIILPIRICFSHHYVLVLNIVLASAHI